uniref:Uncharacterized protein n=1 Tax=Oryza barthii TaxID=65489 RepID=A0A0D3HIM3_9ORYZ
MAAATGYGDAPTGDDLAAYDQLLHSPHGGDLRRAPAGRRRPAAPSASATTSSTAAAVLTTPPTTDLPHPETS